MLDISISNKLDGLVNQQTSLGGRLGWVMTLQLDGILFFAEQQQQQKPELLEYEGYNNDKITQGNTISWYRALPITRYIGKLTGSM